MELSYAKLTEKETINVVSKDDKVFLNSDGRLRQGTVDDVVNSSSLKTEVDNLKKSASDGKKLVAEAITGKGVTTATDASYATMASNIESIKTGSGNAGTGDVLSGKTFSNDDGEQVGTMANKGAWTGATTGSGNVTIPAGYHNGSGYVSGSGAYNAGVSYADGRANTASTNYKTGYNAGVSATKVGTAGAGDVLTGKTFTNSSSVGASGTMANKAGTTVDASAVSQDSTYTYLTVPANGYYNTASKVRTKNSNLSHNLKYVACGTETVTKSANATWTTTINKSTYGLTGKKIVGVRYSETNWAGNTSYYTGLGIILKLNDGTTLSSLCNRTIPVDYSETSTTITISLKALNTLSNQSETIGVFYLD